MAGLFNSLRQPVFVRLLAADLAEAFVDGSEVFGDSFDSDLTSISASSASGLGVIAAERACANLELGEFSQDNSVPTTHIMDGDNDNVEG